MSAAEGEVVVPLAAGFLDGFEVRGELFEAGAFGQVARELGAFADVMELGVGGVVEVREALSVEPGLRQLADVCSGDLKTGGGCKGGEQGFEPGSYLAGVGAVSLGELAGVPLAAAAQVEEEAFAFVAELVFLMGRAGGFGGVGWCGRGLAAEAGLARTVAASTASAWTSRSRTWPAVLRSSVRSAASLRWAG